MYDLIAKNFVSPDLVALNLVATDVISVTYVNTRFIVVAAVGLVGVRCVPFGFTPIVSWC